MTKLERLASKRIRTCRTVHACALCDADICCGEQYHDGGRGMRAHVTCVRAEIGASRQLQKWYRTIPGSWLK